MKIKKKRKSIIHLGTNKTATTSFQINLFSKLNNVGYLGQHCKQNKKIKAELKNIITQDEYFFNDKIIKQKISEIKKKRTGTFIYSDEDVISSNNLSRTAERLKKLLPNATIVLTLRNQCSAIESWYKSHGKKLKMVPKKFFGKHVDYNEWIDYCYKFKNLHTTPNQVSPFMAMDYKRTIDIFSKFFKKQNIKILIYEDFKINPNKIFYEWSKLLDINKKIIKNCIQNKKKYRKSASHLKCIINKTNKIKVKKYFSKGNLKLSQKYNLNLKKYNYPL